MINKINEIIDEKKKYQLQALRLEAENKRLKEAIKAIKASADTFDYWNSCLTYASHVINEIKETVEDVTDER
jgi:hypothetical protein